MSVERLHPQCVSCLLNKYLKKLPENLSAMEKTKYMQGMLKIVANADVSKSVPEIVAEIAEYMKKFGLVTDYTEIKRYFNALMLTYEEDIEERIIKSNNPLESAIKYALIGNYIDFGAVENINDESLKEKLDSAENIKIDNKEFEQFKEEIKNACNIVYLIDNCGEIVFDKLLIKQILNLNNGVNFDVIVRGKPVLNDCTMEDAKQVGLDEMVSVIDNGTAIGGTALEKISKEAKEKIDNADLIISKGQGNFETLHHVGKNIYYLFLCKCKLFSDRFSVPMFTAMFINDFNLE